MATLRTIARILRDDLGLTANAPAPAIAPPGPAPATAGPVAPAAPAAEPSGREALERFRAHLEATRSPA